jgi:hypothetical protein
MLRFVLAARIADGKLAPRAFLDRADHAVMRLRVLRAVGDCAQGAHQGLLGLLAFWSDSSLKIAVSLSHTSIEMGEWVSI